MCLRKWVMPVTYINKWITLQTIKTVGFWCGSAGISWGKGDAPHPACQVDSCFDKYYSREFPQHGTGQSRGLPGDLPLSAPHQCWLEVCLPELSTWSRMAKLKRGPQRSNRSIEALFSTEQKRLFPRAVIDFLLSHLSSSSLPKEEAHPSCTDFGSPGGAAGPPPLTILSCDNLGGVASAFLYITRAALRLEEPSLLVERG